MSSEIETLVEKLMLVTNQYTGNPEADGRWLDAFATQFRAAIDERIQSFRWKNEEK